MPWTSIKDLPPAFKGLPDGAKEIALSVGNDAMKDGATDEEAITAMWGAVKNKYEKSGDKWVLRESVMDDKNTFHSTWLDSVGEIEYFEEAAEVEGEEPRKSIKVTLIREGFSDNVHEARRGKKYRRYYPASTLERAVDMAEGLPIYVGNATDHTAVKTLRDKAGVLRNVFIGEVDGRKAIQGYFKPYSDHAWLLDRAKEDNKAFGPSIEAGGSVKCPATINGTDAAIVESLEELRAGLLVDNPAAGGAIHTVFESKQNGGVRMDGEIRVSDLTEAQLKDFRDYFWPIFESEKGVEAKDAKIKELTEAGEAKDEKIKELEDQFTEAKSVELIEAAFPVTESKDDKGNDIKVHVFTEATRDRLKEQLKGETDEEEIKKVVEAAQEELNGHVEAKGGKPGEPVNAGGGKAPPGEGDGKGTRLTEAEKKVESAFGVKENEDAEKDKK